MRGPCSKAIAPRRSLLSSCARTIHHPRALTAYRRLVPTPRGTKERVSTAVRLPVELHTELQRQAEEREVSVNYLITRAVQHYLQRLSAPDPVGSLAMNER